MRTAIAIGIGVVCVAGVSPGRSRAPSSFSPLTIGPYLQDARSDGATVVWESAEPSRGEVIVEEPGGRERRFEGPHGLHHEVRVSGLHAGSYPYRVVTDTVPVRAELTTAPSEDHFTFVVEGDTRDEDDPHSRVVAAMQRELPDLVFHVGDLVRDGASEEQWHRFFAIEEPLLASTPLYPIVGNHELVDDASGINYHRYFVLPGEKSARYYHFRVANTLFIALDGNTSRDPVQARWLEHTLAASEGASKGDSPIRHVFVFVHQPPFSDGIFCGLAMDQALWIPLFERYHVRAVISGHEHNYERLARNGVRYFITGGGGAPLIAERFDCPDWDRESLQKFRAVHHYLRIRVRGDRANLDAISPEGEVFDSVELDEAPVGSEARFAVPAEEGALTAGR